MSIFDLFTANMPFDSLILVVRASNFSFKFQISQNRWIHDPMLVLYERSMTMYLVKRSRDPRGKDERGSSSTNDR